ncbi:MAG: hypothetical protein Kow0025_08520 [Thermodesulfovibrionales bacterium]
MTDREIIDIVRGSDLWKTLSAKEKVDAIAYALRAAGRGHYLSERDAACLMGAGGDTLASCLALFALPGDNDFHR